MSNSHPTKGCRPLAVLGRKWLCLGCVRGGVGKARTVIWEILSQSRLEVLNGGWVIWYNRFPEVLCANVHSRAPL